MVIDANSSSQETSLVVHIIIISIYTVKNIENNGWQKVGTFQSLITKLREYYSLLFKIVCVYLARVLFDYLHSNHQFEFSLASYYDCNIYVAS